MITPKLIAAAAAVFAANPEAQEVHVCEDGNVFLPERKQLAQAHCAANRLPAPVMVSRETAESAMRLADTVKQANKEAEQAAAAEAEAKAKEEAEQAAAAEAEAKAKEEAEQAAAAEAEAKAKEEAEQAAAKSNAAKKKGK